MQIVQLDLFDQYDEFAEMKKYVYKTNSLVKNVQRGVFKRLDDHRKHVLDLYDNVDQLKFEIDKLRHQIKLLKEGRYEQSN